MKLNKLITVIPAACLLLTAAGSVGAGAVDAKNVTSGAVVEVIKGGKVTSTVNCGSPAEAWAQAIASAVGADETVITLGSDWSEDVLLTIGSGMRITLDLNGHYIRRTRDHDTERNGEVFCVQKSAVFTVRDSSQKYLRMYYTWSYNPYRALTDVQAFRGEPYISQLPYTIKKALAYSEKLTGDPAASVSYTAASVAVQRSIDMQFVLRGITPENAYMAPNGLMGANEEVSEGFTMYYCTTYGAANYNEKVQSEQKERPIFSTMPKDYLKAPLTKIGFARYDYVPYSQDLAATTPGSDKLTPWEYVMKSNNKEHVDFNEGAITFDNDHMMSDNRVTMFARREAGNVKLSAEITGGYTTTLVTENKLYLQL